MRDIVDAFRSPKRRIARAKRHINDFEAIRNIFLRDSPPAMSKQVHDTGDTYFKVQMKPLPDELEDLAVDVLDCLRSALDQAGYASASCFRSGDIKSAYFPFADTTDGLKNAVKGRCKDLRSEIIDLMLAFEPYQTGDRMLWGLNKARGQNQHAILAPSTVGLTERNYHEGKLLGGYGGFFNPPVWDRQNNQLLLAVLSPGSDIEFDVELVFDVVFDEVPALSGPPALAILYHLSSKVERIVMAIEAETARILR